MIEIKDIKMKYGSEDILKGIDYVFQDGLIYGLIGKNGAGKTTLLKIIIRLINENEGNIFIDGRCIDNVDYLKIPAIFISDAPIFYNDLTVKEQLLLVCSAQNTPRKEALYKIDSLLEELKLTKYKDYFPLKLSKGTLQRFNVALGVLRNESIILMDEPFNALDPVQVSVLEKLIKKLKINGKTLLVSSHDIDSLNSICDIYLILKDGKLLEYRPDQLTKESIAQIIGDSYGD